ncbi:leucine-rich repeat-containing protein 46 isoform X2 [Xenopus laevis]|uniref:Leucine-rich repeat-containing protein 46 isoform X2 n=1 Tax=Xenopus laevis TaxID=8355 RepID=A0A8J0TK81_XENLA|nr:leucine-rich repeat-containing protein 46 isoform X2 [Xenopus laevis]
MAGGHTEITIETIARRNLDPTLHHATGQQVEQALLLLHCVRLDRERITKMRSLESVRETHSLYLQQNLIKKIENLDLLQNLRFLSLSGNRIEEVTNLRFLQNLQLLDLSHNLIQRLNEGELPPKLLALDMRENGCTHTPGYRQKVMAALPLLQELDGEIVGIKQSQELALESEEEDESDTDDTSLSYTDSGITSQKQSLLCAPRHTGAITAQERESTDRTQRALRGTE